ncbi:phytoene desaturase family protein [Nocardia australiensis]|uniref:phytoene desaturase family protein n=1 Tax=Nocardia australiensis TaxID=2887191 RepID=UPI001D1449D5|nr:NAD(P)/FAD-dependent oxidoreductase [Nocardia australiensis]
MKTNADADIVVIGSGHNGLVAAGYLAAAGKRVLVLEHNDYIGGGVSTAELTEPGFLSERCSMVHVLIQANPLITNDELGLLSRYGLEYIHPEASYAAAFEDGSHLPIFRDRAATMAQIAEISPRDAEAYDRFMDLAVQIVDMVAPSFFVPPANAGEQLAMLATTPTGKEMIRASGMSVHSVLAEWFTDERVHIALSRMISEINLAHPGDLNTGLYAYAGPGFNERFGMAYPRGGGEAFTQACARCIEDHGGEIRTSVSVEKVLTEGTRVVGVRTSDGQEIRAGDAVLGAIHPHRLGDMVEGIDPAIARTAAKTRLSTYSALVVHASLDEPLDFKAGPGLERVPWITLTPSSLEAVYRSYDELRRGQLPSNPLLEAGCPSIADPSRAPEGRALLHMLSLTTRNLADGGPSRWESIKNSVADSYLDRLGTYITNYRPGLVRAREIATPLDIEARSASFVNGDYIGLAMHWDQMGTNRPTPELSGYTVPGLSGFYLTGPFMHPGGGVLGGGRATAMVMFDDLELDSAGEVIAR